MKIVLVHNLQFGGAYRRVSEQVRAMEVPVIEVTLAGAELVTEDPVIIPLRHRGATAHPALRPLTRHIDFVNLLHSYRKLHAQVRALEPDVIWVNTCRFLNCVWLPPDLAAKAVYYCDEPRRYDFEKAVRKSTNPWTRALYWPMRRMTSHLDRATVNGVAEIAANSRYIQAQVERSYGRSSEVVSLGVARHFVPPPLGTERSYLLSVGTIIPSKGHDLAIEAAAKSGLGLPMMVIGPRRALEEEARLMKLAHDHGIELTIRTGVSDSELVAAYQGAVATLYLARAEPFGLVSIESQACGTPVIVSDEGGLPETVVDGKTGWAVERSAPGAIEALVRLGDAELAATMRAAAAEYGATWTWTRSSEHLCALFDRVPRP